MSMTTTYSAKILELVLKNFLQDGTVPTADELLEAYEDYIEEHPDMSKPFIMDETHIVDANSQASASAYNDFFERAKSDLEAVYQEVWDRMADGIDSFDNWRIKMEYLKKKLLDLESRIDALLLLRADTAGYFAFVEDNFVDLSKVDQDLTTANVDVVSHAVTLGETNTQQVSVVNLNSLDLGEATFVVLTRDHLLSSREAPGTDVRYAVQDADRSWQHRVRSLRGDIKTSGEFKVQLGDSAIEISRIEIGIHASNMNTPMVLTGMYSLDNYNWYNLPTDNYVQSTDDRALFVFPKTEMKWVKIIMTKIGADDIDNDQYIYEFGMASCKFFTTSGYNTTSGNMFYSQELSAYDSDDNRIEFNKVALQTCQQTPDETTIQYWIQAQTASEETEWLRIDPFTTEEPVAPVVLELGRALETEVENLLIAPHTISDSTDFFSVYIDAIETDSLALLGAGVTNGSPPPDYTAPTTVYTIAAATVANMIEDQIVFYRNVGRHLGVQTVTYRNVRDAPRGWKYTDSTEAYIQTTIVVNNADGLDVNLGDQTAFLNGAVIGPGLTNIPAGTHTFKTLTKNTWAFDAADSYAWSGGFQNKAQLEESLGSRQINHKLLIEGVLYHDDYPIEEREYLGVDLFCECVAKRVSTFDLLHNTTPDNGYGYYATDTTVDGNRVFLVRFDPVDYNSTYPNEYFTIKYKTGSSMFDRIVLKAELSSTASTDDKTPILTAYRIKLGS